MVSIAYRVGVFGFLAHPELSRESGRGSGNYGLEDQIAGLKWVKQNIGAFGGDPSRVTIFGESAGGISVSMLAASPEAKGLFHQAISESGGSFAPPRYDNEGGETVFALKVAEANGEDYLKRLGVKDINAARAQSAEAVQKAMGPPMGQGFWPVLDGNVIVGDQYELYQAGRFNDTPVLIGTNSDEGALFSHGPVSAAQFESQIRQGYGAKADTILAGQPIRMPPKQKRPARRKTSPVNQHLRGIPGNGRSCNRKRARAKCTCTTLIITSRMSRTARVTAPRWGTSLAIWRVQAPCCPT